MSERSGDRSRVVTAEPRADAGADGRPTTFDASRLGARIRRSRQDAGLSLTAVARRLGITASALSQIETGVMAPSVSRLVEIMGVLGAPLGTVFDDPLPVSFPPPYARPTAQTALTGVTVARAAQATTVDLAGGVVYRRLTPAPLPGTEYFESVYPPGAASGPPGRLLVHPGVETGTVTSGRLTFQFADGEVELAAGDCIHFPASTGHRVVNRTSSVAVATWLTAGLDAAAPPADPPPAVPPGAGHHVPAPLP